MIGKNYTTRSPEPSGPRLLAGGPTGRLDFALRPCDPCNDALDSEKDLFFSEIVCRIVFGYVLNFFSEFFCQNLFLVFFSEFLFRILFWNFSLIF